jgi:hypothetical protein
MILFQHESVRFGSWRFGSWPFRPGWVGQAPGPGSRAARPGRRASDRLLACLPGCSIPDPGSGSLSVPCRALDCIYTHMHTYPSIYIHTHTSICLAYNVASDSSYLQMDIHIHTHTHASISVLTLLWHVAPHACCPRTLGAAVDGLFPPQQLTAVRQLAAFSSAVGGIFSS